MRTKLLLLLLLANLSIYAQDTSIPDINFEKKLISLGIDSGTPDGKVLTANVSAVTSLSISNSNISDLTGIQDFVALKTLYCDNNRIRILDLSKNIALTELRCFYNKLISLNLKTGKKLSYLDLDTSNNFTLECILVDNVALIQNWRKKIDVLTKFNDVACYTYTKILDENFEKKLIALGIDTDGKNGKVITANIASLTTLDISYSGIADLTGLEDFLSLTNLNFAGNALTSFDPSIILSLRSLDCSSNLLQTLNITKNTNLSSLNCSKNNLSSLNLQNGQNRSLINLSIKSNPNLPCILVDNTTYATATWTEKDLASIFSETVCTPAYTLIPDANFENRLIALGIDTDGKNGKVITANIAGITTLDVSGKFINNLTGIQDFKALKTLDCSNNRLKTLDLTKNIALERLDANTNLLSSTIDLSMNTKLLYFNSSTNQLTTLDFSKNIALKEIICQSNLLNTLNVSQNFALTSINIIANKLTGLDLSKNISLNYLICNENLLTSLDFSNNPLLEVAILRKNKLTSVNVAKNSLLHELDLEDNQLANIDVSKNRNLVWLYCQQNKLTKLDVSQNISLSWFNCSSNQLTTLDVSKNVSLDYFYCGGNNLLNLNLKNGRNKYITRFSCFSNSQLNCILVDDAAYSNTNWSDKKDEHMVFSDTPCTLYTSIPDINFENKLIALGLDSPISDGKILTENIANITSLDVSSSAIVDLSGIQDFIALKDLKCNSNQIKNLDLSKNIVLGTLDCSSNQLTNLSYSKNLALKNLNCSSNQLTTLDTLENGFLTSLDCHSNQINTLDISSNISLTTFLCNDNKLSALNLKNGKNNLLVSLNFKTNPNLSCILVDDPSSANTNWLDFKDNSATYNKDCFSPYTLIPDANFENKLIALGIDTDGKNGKVLTSSIAAITSIDVSSSLITDLTGIQDFENLTNLNCQNNQISNLNISQNIALTDLNCYHNPLASLDVSNNTGLLNLSCGFNQLSNLDLSTNTALINLDCSVNNLTYLDVSKNKALTSLNCNTNLIKKLDFSKNTNLTALNCGNNNLVNLNIKNEKNAQLTTYNFKLNPKLSCIQVDNTSYANTNWLSGKDNIAIYNETSCTAYTLIPDPNFESFLVKFGFDNDGYNGKVATENIKSIKTLYIDNNSIEDFTGIEDFESLTLLDCSSNSLTILDLSKNTALTYLDCSANRLTSLNITKNTALKTLKCSNIDKHYNRGLTNLDISQNIALTSLTCISNRFTTLDVSKNTALTQLECYDNNLTNLDISNNLALVTLSFSKNLIKRLDITNHKALTQLKCNDNKLTELNLKNGKNNLLNILESNFQTNPDLSCIQVDDATYSNTNWTNIRDISASYNSNCGIPNTFTLINDIQFEKKLIEMGIDKDGENGKIENSSINKLISIDLSSSSIKDLSGIENFTSLTYLDCSNNQLTTLDVSKILVLETLNASSNQITTLDLSKNVNLRIVYVVNNPLVSLNLKNGNNKNFVLPVETGKKSASLYTSFLGITTLGCIQVDDAHYSNANWSKIKETSTTYSNTCKSLGLEDNTFDKFAIYPNPTKGEVNIQNVNLEKATVYNSLGQLVKSFVLNSADTNNTINLSGLPKGVYYIYLINQDATSAKKIIVE
jgi:Leucine-rich repeat (LRR) protein